MTVVELNRDRSLRHEDRAHIYLRSNTKAQLEAFWAEKFPNVRMWELSDYVVRAGIAALSQESVGGDAA